MADFDENGQKIAADLQNKFTNVRVLFQHVNVADEESVSQLAKIVLNKFGTIDAIINNAGIFAKGALHELDSQTWDRVMKIDVKSIFLMTKAFVPQMMKQNSGSIINIASISGLSHVVISQCKM